MYLFNNCFHSIDVSMNLSKFFDMGHFFLLKQFHFSSIFRQTFGFVVKRVHIVQQSQFQFFQINGFGPEKEKKKTQFKEYLKQYLAEAIPYPFDIQTKFWIGFEKSSQSQFQFFQINGEEKNKIVNT